MFLRAVGPSIEEQISEMNTININKSNHTNTLSSKLLFRIMATSNV
jgi:hypothetical protein